MPQVAVVLGNERVVARMAARPDDLAQKEDPDRNYPFFGEIGLINNKPAMAYIRATSACKVLTVSRANFARFLDLLPRFEERVQYTASLRAKLQQNRQQQAAKAAEAHEMAVRMKVATATDLLASPLMKRRTILSNADARSDGLASFATAATES